MITNNGKDIISKYLLGQAPAYATHISIGCGATPLDPTDPEQEDIATKNTMDFEMTRVPISSRGFVEEDGITKVSLIAQLPTENRYEISEVGLWSGPSNSLAKGFDSRVIFDFQEEWQAHDVSVDPIDLVENLGSGGTIDDGGRTVFRVNSGNSLLEEAARKARKEGPRFLNSSIFMRGDSSNIESSDIEIVSASANGTQIIYTATNSFVQGDKITVSSSSNELFDVINAQVISASAGGFTINKNTSASASSLGGVAWKTGTWSPEEDLEGFTSKHIHLNGISLNIGNNSPSDILTLAISLVDKDSVGNGNPEFVKILVEFFRNEISQDNGYAKAEIYIPGSEFTDRYKAISFPISNLITSPDFSSSEVRIARVFCYVGVTDGPSIVGSTNHYVSLDGFRLDNISTNNPLYKMVGYSSTRTADGSPVIKFRNTNNFVEFRFAVGVT